MMQRGVAAAASRAASSSSSSRCSSVSAVSIAIRNLSLLSSTEQVTVDKEQVTSATTTTATLILSHLGKTNHQQQQQQQQQRLYSTSRPLYKDEDDSKNNTNKDISNDLEGEEFITVNSTRTQEEIRAIFAEEMTKLEEEETRKKYLNWKPGERKKPLRMSYNMQDFEDDMHPENRWTLRDKRCGALAIKLGMMPIWDEWGERHACTVLYLDSNVVVRNKTEDGVDGYNAVQLAAGEYKKKNVTKPLLCHYAKYGVDEKPPYIVREFRVTTKEAMPEPGSRIHARHFIPGQNVDVSGISKGKGFQGGMKRHGFAGMPATHGVSKSHRAIGSTGQCQDPGRVFKGKKMPGRMGVDRVTVQNLRVVKIDRGRDLIYVKGAVPGNKGGFVEIRDAVKKPLFGTDKIEGGKDLKKPPLPTFEYEEGVDGSGKEGFEVMMPPNTVDPLAPKDEPELSFAA